LLLLVLGWSLGWLLLLLLLLPLHPCLLCWQLCIGLSCLQLPQFSPEQCCCPGLGCC
jgi:hypothetical protein